MTLHVVLSEDIHPEGRAVLEAARTRVSVAPGTDEPALRAALADADGLILRASGRVTETVLAGAPRLRVIGRHGVGLDNIDLHAAAARGVTIVHTPGANTVSVAEHTVACVLTLLRRLPEQDRAVRRGDWQLRDRISGLELRGRLVGIVGMGNIGAQVGAILRHGFGMRVVYTDPVPRPAAEAGLDAARLGLTALLSCCNVVTVHVPLTRTTHGLIGGAALALMRPTALLVNVSRGGVVDERALVNACERGLLAGAALDVFAREPLPPEDPLLHSERILLTPHSAALTEEGARRMSLVAEDVLAVLTGGQPKHPVLLPPIDGMRARPEPKGH